MTFPDAFRHVSAEARSRIKIQRSEFTGIAFPVGSDPYFHEFLTAVSKEFFDATHRCWAYRIRDDGGPRERSSDAGEPAGTAGKPIAQALESAELLDSGVIVVRYFGGTKLGTGGLARAYRQAAREAIAAAPVDIRYLYDELSVEVPFDSMQTIYRLIAPPDVVLRKETFGEVNVFTLDVRKSIRPKVEEALTRQRIRIVVREQVDDA